MSADLVALGKKVLEVEANAIRALSDRIDQKFLQAVDSILKCRGKLVTTGMGKSGLIARKLASTFSSTGTAALYLHPAESIHGDMGVMSEGDVVLALSNSGESSELAHVVSFCARRGIPVLALTGNPQSSLAQAATVVLNCHVSEEACPLGLAPTASTTACLALGDALAMCVLQARGFSVEDFASVHPGGRLGARLLTRVRDLMHTGEAVPLVTEDTPLRQVFSMMTNREVRGVAGVVDTKGDLVGVITDGDIRRRLERNADPFQGSARELMNPNPRVIAPDELAEKAVFLMEQFKIQLLFVADEKSSRPQKPLGVLNYQDLFKAKL